VAGICFAACGLATYMIHGSGNHGHPPTDGLEWPDAGSLVRRVQHRACVCEIRPEGLEAGGLICLLR